MIDDSAEHDGPDVWRVLDYEVQMFLGTEEIRSSFQIKDAATHLTRNALVESSLLHIRILADLFLSRGTQPDDINLAQLGAGVDGEEPYSSGESWSAPSRLWVGQG